MAEGDYKMSSGNDSDEVKITEWHGLVPSAYIDPDLEEDEEFEELEPPW